MQKNNEIKRILLGRLVRNEQGALTARPQGIYTQVNGFVDGYFSVLLFGVMKRTRTYRWESSKKTELEIIRRHVQQLGEELYLKEEPEAIASFTGKMVFTPTVVKAEISGKTLEITVYTGRTPLGILRCMLVHRRLEHLLGDLVSRIKK